MTKHSGTIHFAKMHGLGNDFVIIHDHQSSFDIKQFSIKQLADRHIGIGFDQLLVLEPEKNGTDFYCRIINADGSEAEQCGNGLRCVARYIHENGLLKKPSFNIATKAGVFPVTIHDYDHISVLLAAPAIQENLVDIMIDKNTMPMSVLSTGNPHAILKVASIDSIIPSDLAPKITAQSYFPHGANVGFMQIINDTHIRLRTYERGAGETHACGSNACAAVVAGIMNGWLKQQVTVEFRYGKLTIEWEGDNSPIKMTGPAAQVFSGVLK